MKCYKWTDDNGKHYVRFDWLESGVVNASVVVNSDFFKDPDTFINAMNVEINACKSEAVRLLGVER